MINDPFDSTIFKVFYKISIRSKQAFRSLEESNVYSSTGRAERERVVYQCPAGNDTGIKEKLFY